MGCATFAIDSPSGEQLVCSSNRTEQFVFRAWLFFLSLFLISAHLPVSTLGPSTLRSLRSAYPKLCSIEMVPTQTSVTASVWTWTSATFWASRALCSGRSICQDYKLNNQLFKKKSEYLFIYCLFCLQRSVWARLGLMSMSKELLNWHRRQV